MKMDNGTTIMTTVLGIVDAEMFAESEAEATLAMTWERLDPGGSQRARITAALRAAFPSAGVLHNDRKLFGYDVSLGQLCDELERRMEVKV